jgi:uncharacterized membrane-anchored protein
LENNLRNRLTVILSFAFGTAIGDGISEGAGIGYGHYLLVQLFF